MVFLPAKGELAVQPDFPAVLRSKPQLDRLILVRGEFAVSISRDSFQSGVSLVDVDNPVFVGAPQILPTGLSGFSLGLRGLIDLLFRRIDRRKPFAARA